jgi:hypothetical protein
LTFTLTKPAKDADGKEVTLTSKTYPYSVKYGEKKAAQAAKATVPKHKHP